MKKFILGVTAFCTITAHAMQLKSQHALVINDETGQVLIEKGADASVPIASLTKLMTAMVVLDSKPDMNSNISIDAADVDTLKHSKSRVPLGTTLPRKKAMQLALIASDNRTAAALTRTYAGGNDAFKTAVISKLKQLGMTHTVIQEPTGLSPDNISTATDLAKMAMAASGYPDIAAITTARSDKVDMNGRSVTFRNTNRLVAGKRWNILLSKTGFTNEAGYCLIMRTQQAGYRTTLILLNSKTRSASMADAQHILQLLANQPPPPSLPIGHHRYRHLDAAARIRYAQS